MLGEQVVGIYDLAAHGNHPGTIKSASRGETTWKSAQVLMTLIDDEPALFPAATGDWLARIDAATKQRDRIVHAVARGQCAECGAERDFVHSRSGDVVDRSTEAVAEVTEEFRDLRAEGVSSAHDVAQRVNDRLVRIAKDAAAATGEPQTPPQVSPGEATHICADCDQEGRGSTTIALGTSVAVFPPGTDLKALVRITEPDGAVE